MTPPRPEVCVGAVAERDGCVLLIRRGRGVAVDTWSVPGGRVEPGEEVRAAVVRELLEETGIVADCGELVGWAERLGPDHHFVILDFRVHVAGTVAPRAGDDAADAAWVPWDEVRSRELAPGLADFFVEHGFLGPPA